MNLRKRVEAVIRSDATVGVGWLGICLSVVSELYGVGVRLRQKAYAQGWIKTSRLDCLVVSVGNLTLGGTGKTPMTIYLARLIQSYGYSVVVISRGYKGSSEGRGGVVSDGKDLIMKASACGDEAYMMAVALETIPVLMGSDRYTIGRTAIKSFNPQVILLDDAFQHIRLERDIDIVLLDAENPFGNRKLFPRGMLREEKGALYRAGAVVLTRAELTPAEAVKKVEQYAPEKPIFQCKHRPYIAGIVPAKAPGSIDPQTAVARPGLESLRGRRGYLFSGIARNEGFMENMEKAGVQTCGTSFFDDHHWYSPEDLKDIMQSADSSGAELIITTEKDFVRIPQTVSWPLDLVVVGVEIQFPDHVFDTYIRRELAWKIK